MAQHADPFDLHFDPHGGAKAVLTGLLTIL